MNNVVKILRLRKNRVRRRSFLSQMSQFLSELIQEDLIQTLLN